MAEVSNSGQPARPPTPPKAKPMSEVLDDAIGFLDTSDQAFAQNPLHTPPPSSPLKSQERSKHRKKIRFDLEPSLIEDGSSDVEASSQSSRRSTGVGASTQKTTSRSILKPYDPNTFAKATDSDVSLSSIPPSQFASLGTMLEAAVALLAKPDRASKLEAYLAIQNGLREYTDAISTDALRMKLPLFEGFIERDIDANSELHGGKDSKLVGQASKLAQYFLFKDSLFDALSNDFKTFLMDRVIMVLEDRRSPKEIVKNHAVALTNERFLAKALKGDRPSKLLNALIVLHEHVSGEVILGVRLIIYQKLAHVAGNTMLTRINEWLPQIWAGMLSGVTETRAQAVAACAIAGTCFGHHTRASHAMKAFLERESLGHGVNFDYVEGVLNKWLRDSEKKSRVPPMWGVVIMFMRSDSRCLDEWSRLGRWLKIIQVCFNSSDLALNEEAWTQWNNLIFAVNPTSQTSPTLRRYLVTPIISILQRRHQTKISPEIRHAAWCSFCVLLYYSFRPGASSESLALFWKDFLQEAASKLAPLSNSNVDRLYAILHAVLGGSKLQLWDADRYKETFRERVYPEELPRIDPAWTRRHLQMILDTIIPLVVRSADEDQKSAEATFTVLFQAVRNAASKEIKTSAEQKTAVSAILNFLKSLTSQPVDPLNSVPRLTHKAIYVCLRSAIKALGASIFVEPIICQLRNSGQFQAAVTPARTPPAHTGRAEAPIASIFRILTSLSLEPEAQREFRENMKSILRSCMDVKTDSESQLVLLKSCADSLQSNPAGQATSALIPLWESVVDSSISFTDAIGRMNVHGGKLSLASQYRTLVRILITGRRFVASPSRRWERLYKSLCAHVQITIGDGGVVLAVLEPLLRDESLSTEKSEAIRSGIAAIMLESGLPQPNTRMLEFAQKRLWADEQHHDLFAFANSWLETFMLFVQSCILRALPTSGSQAHELAHALDVFVRTTPSETAFEAVCVLGTSVTSLVASLTANILRHADSGLKLSASPASQLWTHLIDLLSANFHNTNESLRQVEDVFLAGFALPSRHLAQQTIKAWNSTFGKSESLQYSPKLENIIIRLQRVAVVKAGGLNNVDSQASQASQPETLPFNGINDNELFPWLQQADDGNEGACHPEPQHRLTPLGKYTKLHTRKLPEMPKTLIARRTTPISSPRNKTPSKPRHEDSQIEFVTVESSPIDYNSIESQLLTAHQQEVQDRQKNSAALYEELHSTPLVRKSSLKSKGSRPVQSSFGDVTSDRTSLEPESSPLARSRPRTNSRSGLPIIRIIDDHVESDLGDIPSSPPDVEDGQKPSTTTNASKALQEVIRDDQDVVEEQLPPPSPLLLKLQRSSRPLAEPTEQNISKEDQSRDSTTSDAGSMSKLNANRDPLILQSQAMSEATPLADISHNASLGRRLSTAGEDVSRVIDSFVQKDQIADKEPRKRVAQSRATKVLRPASPANRESKVLQKATPAAVAPTRSSTRLALAQEAGYSTSRASETHSSSPLAPSEDVIITGKKRRNPVPSATDKTSKRVKTEQIEEPLLSQPQIDESSDNMIIWEAPTEDTPTFEDEFMLQMSQEGSSSGDEVKAAPRKPKTSTLKRSRSGRPIKQEAILDSEASFSSTSSEDSKASTRFTSKRRRNDAEANDAMEALQEADSASRKRRKTVKVQVQVARQPTPEPAAAAPDQDGMSSQYATPMSTQSASPTMAQRAHRLIGMMRSALGECRKLVLGSQEEPERQSLEDLGYEVSREIVDAGRRGRRRA